MTKKHFIALADAIKSYNRNQNRRVFTRDQMEALACFCAAQNRAFDRDRWLGYIAGTCGPNGGSVERSRRSRTATEVGTVTHQDIGRVMRAGQDRAIQWAAPSGDMFVEADFAELERRSAHIADAVAYAVHALAETPVLTPAEIRVPSPVPSLEDSINFLRSR